VGAVVVRCLVVATNFWAGEGARAAARVWAVDVLVVDSLGAWFGVIVFGS
jgi:hypothetical protein